MSGPAADLLEEAGRKAFHLLSLVYLAAYLWLPGAVWWLGLWALAVTALEFARLRVPAMNRLLLAPFAAARIMRGYEAGRLSGIFHTSWGCFLTAWLFGADRLVVTAAIWYLALGDAAAALAGRVFGRHTFSVRGKRKSLEGSAACLAVCLAVGAALGLPWPAAVAGAAACTLVEAIPLGFDDNALLPVASALALWLAR